jgi:hypothetical protein
MQLPNRPNSYLRPLAAALATAGIAVFLPAPAAADAPPQNAAPAWQEPTPAEGTTISVAAGTTATIRAAATDPNPGDTVHIDASGLLPEAALAVTDGNPATATISFKPTGTQRAAARITLTARDSAATTATRTLVHEMPPPRRVSLVGPRETWRWAYVLAETAARSGPSSGARVVSRVPTGTSQGLPNLLLLLAEQRNARGALWVQVRLAVLPNGSTGWVPRRVLDAYHVVHTHLIVDRARETAELFRSGRRVFHTRVGVGKPSSPTPRGEFYVREVVSGFGDPFYGPVAFGTSARSTVLTDWPGGGFIGIHGTNAPELLPGRVSHGCVRLRNADILRLARLMPLGTPVSIA